MITTEFIAHRLNSIQELGRLPQEYGVEVDLRDRGNQLILQHDPFREGEDFEGFLQHYRHGTIILNIKSEGLEYKVLELLQKHQIRRYFFLDSSFPMIVKLSSAGERNIALRLSEFEGLDTILNMAGRVEWVWIDCFTRLPLDARKYRVLKDAGFKLCLVSPDLVGRPQEIASYRQYLISSGLRMDSICTKAANIPRWRGSSPQDRLTQSRQY